jgi:hypothetical protein
MRFYAIVIEGAPADIFPPRAGAYVPGAQWCSVIGGENDPGAQQVVLDLNALDAAIGSSNCTVTIQNPTLQQISQMADLKELVVSVYGGMYPGLPLARWHYERNLTGFLMSGQIVRCWGEWVGTEMSLSFAFIPTQFKAAGAGSTIGTGGAGKPGEAGATPVGNAPAPQATRYRSVGPRSIRQRASVMPMDISLGGISFGSGFESIAGGLALLFGGGGTLSAPLNLIHNLMPNMPLSSAIQQTLSTAFPGAKLNINVSDNLKLPSQDAGMYQSLTQYAAYLQQLSQNILGTQNNYQGIHTTTHGDSLDVWDGQFHGATKALAFYDLIGQPTWIAPFTVQFKCVMRCDIHVGPDHVLLPPGLMGVGEGAGSAVLLGPSAKQGVLNFGGLDVGPIMQVHHSGDFRNPDGNAWCTIIDGIVSPRGETAGTGGPHGAGLAGEFTGTPVAPPPPPPTALMNRSVRRYG